MKLSVIIISYHSNHLLKKILKIIPKKYQILIVENSLLKSTKNLEKKFKNTKVIIPKENLGYAKAFNLAFNICKNNFILTLTPDTLIKKNVILEIEKTILKFKDFTLLAPEYKNQQIYRNFTPIEGEDHKSKRIKKFSIQKVKEIDWCFCILNKKKFKKQKILDEKFFMYFETIDLCKSLIKLKHKMYIIKELKFDHLGSSSTIKKYNNEISMNRNWHFSWSKFYYFRKHHNYLYALKKIIPNIYQNIIGIILSVLKVNRVDAQLHYASLLGAINAIFLNKSNYRPKLK